MITKKILGTDVFITAENEKEGKKKVLDFFNKKNKTKATNSFADLNKDGKVNSEDFSIASKTLNKAKKKK